MKDIKYNIFILYRKIQKIIHVDYKKKYKT
jgi:hypothetical protein